MESLCELRIDGSKQLSGSLPGSWGALPVTDSLSLSGNSLSGTSPCTSPPALVGPFNGNQDNAPVEREG